MKASSQGGGERRYRVETRYYPTYTFSSLIVRKMNDFYEAYLGGNYEVAEEVLQFIFMDMPPEVYSAVKGDLAAYFEGKVEVEGRGGQLEHVHRGMVNDYMRRGLLKVYRRVVEELHRRRLLADYTSYLAVEEPVSLAEERSLGLEGRRRAD